MALKHDWQLDQVNALYSQPFNHLLAESHAVFAEHFDVNRVQVSTLLSIKTGGCPEDCAYCPQSAHYQTDLQKESLLEVEAVVKAATKAKEAGASRFCMGAAWRGPRDKDLQKVAAMVKEVKALGLETCATLGLLQEHQAEQLKLAGLDFYNHNIDTSASFYGEIISTRNFEDRLSTLEYVRNQDIKVCSGGIIGMGESAEDRASMLMTLANLPQHPQSVPINRLVKVEGTPLADMPADRSPDTEVPATDIFDFIRTIAVARIMMPQSYVRLSAGREDMSEEAQALCFFAGANSIFYGEKLLTTNNPVPEQDKRLFTKLGLQTA